MRVLHLPSLHTVQGKYVVGAQIAGLSATLYLVPNHWHEWPATYLPMTALDKAIPFWPQTGWVYAATYGLLLITFILVRDLSQASRFLYACLFAQVLAAACFVLCPTVYPRELYPTAGIAISDFWRGVDAPTNCLPSLHVSNVVLCVGAWPPGRRRAAAALVGIPCALSTLTFKQHYVADVIAGLALGLVAWFVFFRWNRISLRPAA
jgi:membrane-associated phospholipid phosphatase